jgi:pimeloyl-ACP methyl ester carboxylesterase
MAKKRTTTVSTTSESCHPRWFWAAGQRTSRQERVPGVVSASFNLSTLVKKQLLDPLLMKEFQTSTGLADFAWRTFYHAGLGDAPLTLEAAMDRAKGLVIFMHGWDGCGKVWENLPLLVCQENSQLICFTLDVNGFGGSSFIEPVPAVEQCDPYASMRAVEHWASLIQLKPSRGRVRRIPFVFVGHSMSGASMFYKSDTDGWERERYGMLALAPALLRGDALRRGFYKTLGVGIIAGTNQGFFDWVKTKLSPHFIEPLIGGASATNKKLHVEIFARTPNGTVAQTFYAMGMAERDSQRPHWDNMKVILGHSDRMVGAGPMLNLLEELGLSSANIRVVLGDHYFFSVGRDSAKTHAMNREIVIEEILALWKAVSQKKSLSQVRLHTERA